MAFHPERHAIEYFALMVFMVAVGALGWWMTLRPQLRVDASPLAELPIRVGHWKSIPIPVDEVVEKELRADFHVQRAFSTSTEGPIWLYSGYYGTQRGGRPEHTPRGCYTGAGWGIESSRTIEIDPRTKLRATEYLVEQSGERRLVHFWYRSHRRTGILGGIDQNIDRLLGRLFEGRADGALIRISTPILQEDTTRARGRLLAFASLIDPVLGAHWPIEIPCATRSDCAPHVDPPLTMRVRSNPPVGA